MIVKKLNNKGLTAIEVLVSFALISVIIISMFNVINNYKDKEDLESYKTDVTTYKNTLTKTIYDDIIANDGVTKTCNASDDCSTCVSQTIDSSASDLTANFEYKLKLCYKRVNKSATIVVHNNDDKSEYYVDFIDSTNNKERFKLPSLYNVKFNEIATYQEPKTSFIRIHIGLWTADFGTKYDALNIITPNTAVYPKAL